ncbi:MAG: PQQ-dependent sugar dehydrogenase [Saprospiraceae bacterium]|nr:PQQ-dependent sugar dehydrogenase [Saprospiraceae bacterium]
MIRPTLVFLALVLFTMQAFAQDEIDITLDLFARGLANPTDIANCGDDRLFIVEKAGRIKIVDADGNVNPTSFIDITAKVNDGASERGLLGLAFHPDYLQNGYFFVNYTNAGGHTIVSRFSVSTDNPNIAEPNSEKVIIQIDQPRTNHNGGDINFGPDGYLYIGMGDGGAAGDPWNNSQTATELLGKMLRIDVNIEDMPYLIPEDNPYYGLSTTRNEIWAFGVRNPWRFSFDREGNLWIADVGQDTWEEIDFQPFDSPGGENYGWSCLEGNEIYIQNRCTLDSADYTYPVFTYLNNFSEGCSVTGGYRYRGCTFPRLYDHYLFTDYCTGKFWSTWKCPTDTCVMPFTTEEIANLQDQQFVSFGEDKDGELYVAAIGLGNIYRIIETNEVFENPEIDSTDLGLVVSGDFDSIQWYQNGDPITEANNAIYQPTELGSYQVEVFSSVGCNKLSDPVVVTDLNSLSTIFLENKVRLFPNPAKSELTVQWENDVNFESLFLCNPQGRIVYRKDVAGSNLVDFTIENLPRGLYILQLSGLQGKIAKKVMVH